MGAFGIDLFEVKWVILGGRSSMAKKWGDYEIDTDLKKKGWGESKMADFVSYKYCVE